MKAQKINLQPLPANTSARHFLKAKHHAFKFKTAKKKLQELLKMDDDVTTDIGEKPRSSKMMFAILAIGVALVLAALESINVKTTIIGSLGISDTFALFIGFAVASIGLLAGDMLVSTASWKQDDYSGKRKPTVKFFIGVALTLTYLTSQYWLASRAGVGTGEDMQETVTTISWFVLGVAVLEVLVGMLFLSTAIRTCSIAINTSRMNRNSRKCDEAWHKHLRDNNNKNPFETVPAIDEARDFYNNGGMPDEDEEKGNDTDKKNDNPSNS